MERNHVEIMEVCPRDGWQNLPDFIPTEDKIRYISGMLDAGVRTMQITSFVHPRAIPQLRDAREVTRAILAAYPDRCFNALIPNVVGAKNAVESGLKEVCYVISVSESHNRANISRTHEESFGELEQIRHNYPDLDITVGLPTTFGCPFEGRMPLRRVLDFVERLAGLGITKVELSDTIGAGDPVQVRATFLAVGREFPHLTLAAHMHDTRNNGVINSWAAMESGAVLIHGAMGGLGGCPFAPGASGNTSTEDLVYLLERAGYHSGIDFERYMDALRVMHATVHGNYSGHQLTIKKPENA